MPIDDPILNCLLEVCCEGPNARESLAQLLVKEGACRDMTHGHRVSACVYEHFDLAERGTLAPLKASIARVLKA